ncbi:disease resistance protein [Striga asiatica]|uniref:Disease resistance protein n=1 Tax=Striga asiatica TaxID=4170 RepID=A0A5A7QZP5_STRAF|nr:disease resistance protein [Striga asiatica]
MQRQSLGSPSSKLAKDEKPSFEAQKQFPSQSSSLSSIDSQYEDRDDDEPAKKRKATAAIRAASVDNPQSYIHLIPMLTLVCFLILYLASHDPSQNELQLIKEINKGEIMAIRRLKNLETTELGMAEQRLLHRKIAHF